MTNSHNLIDYVVLNLRRFRNLSHLRQSDVAHLLGLSPRHYQKIEAGSVEPKFEDLQTLSKQYHIPECYFFRRNQGSEISEALPPCPVEVLDALSAGIQVNDVNGLVTYVNRSHARRLGIPAEKITGRMYIWDFVFDPVDAENLREYLKYLVEKKPKPTPYFTRNKTAQGEEIPVRVDWDYIFNPAGEVKAFVSLIQHHPSW